MRYLLLFSMMSVAACSSAPQRSETSPPKQSTTYESKPVQPMPPAKVEEVIDLRALQTSVKLEPRKEELGYHEKKFNTCQAGAGYSSTVNCRNLSLVVVHFQLMCRDSEGTVSEVVTSANLEPIANQRIKWALNKANDESMTDSNGYAQIVMVSPESQRTQRMRVTLGDDFLFIRAGDARSLIAPKNWCR